MKNVTMILGVVDKKFAAKSMRHGRKEVKAIDKNYFSIKRDLCKGKD